MCNHGWDDSQQSLSNIFTLNAKLNALCNLHTSHCSGCQSCNRSAGSTEWSRKMSQYNFRTSPCSLLHLCCHICDNSSRRVRLKLSCPLLFKFVQFVLYYYFYSRMTTAITAQLYLKIRGRPEDRPARLRPAALDRPGHSRGGRVRGGRGRW